VHLRLWCHQSILSSRSLDTSLLPLPFSGSLRWENTFIRQALLQELLSDAVVLAVVIFEDDLTEFTPKKRQALHRPLS
jgi:hypothetical protein